MLAGFVVSSVIPRRRRVGCRPGDYADDQEKIKSREGEGVSSPASGAGEGEGVWEAAWWHLASYSWMRNNNNKVWEIK